MVTPAEYIQIIAAGIYGAALFFTILTFQRSKRLDQISLATEVMYELMMSKEEFILACLIQLTGFHSWSTKKWSLTKG
jgi:hypothetical protein